MSEVYIKEPNTKGKAILRTTHGDLEIELWATECPKACRNFCQLILEGYYNGTTFHRVIKEFIIQGGDATGTGEGTETIYGEPYVDEIHPRLKFRYRGMMGVASAGKGTKTNGSQFFIVLNRTPSLDGKHTLFGKVVGQTIYNLVRISEVEVDKNDRPVDPPRIVRAELVWDPFGDLEPRYKPPPMITSRGEQEHRRAPVHNKRILSFEADEEDQEEAVTKVKSAHDVLDDPKLLKTTAYPQEVVSGKKRVLEPAKASKEQVAAAARAAAARKSARADDDEPAAAVPEVDYGDEASDQEEESDDDAGRKVSPAELKERQRQEQIKKLKLDIHGLSSGGSKEEVKPKSKLSALEEQRAGYQMRIREKPKGREGKKKYAADILNNLTSFQERLRNMKPAEDEEQEEKEKPKEDDKPKKEYGTLASIYEDVDEESTADWLSGGGLKFHTSGDKAFRLAELKAREMLDIFDPLVAKGNAEVLADTRKRRAQQLTPSIRKREEMKNF